MQSRFIKLKCDGLDNLTSIRKFRKELDLFMEKMLFEHHFMN